MENGVYRILLVDDNEINTISLKQALLRNRYEVETALNGMEAMEKMFEGSFDVLITDLMMPFVSGQQLIEAVKRNGYDNLKIIVLTSVDHEHSITDLFEIGADDYLVKPVNNMELITRLQRLLHQKN